MRLTKYIAGDKVDDGVDDIDGIDNVNSSVVNVDGIDNVDGIIHCHKQGHKQWHTFTS